MKDFVMEDRGTITLGSKVMVSDPCYKLGTWCQGVLENVLSGEYNCKVIFVDEGTWGVRVARIVVIHKDYENRTLRVERENFVVGVDSGTAGIYDYDYYTKYHTDKDKDNAWYGRTYECSRILMQNPNYMTLEDYMKNVKENLTDEDDEFWELNARLEYFGNPTYNLKTSSMPDGQPIDGRGFVSSSGDGDGSYSCFTFYSSDRDEVVGISVEFISEDDEEEDEE